MRSRSTVAQKDEARLALETDARRLNAKIRGAGLDDPSLILLGLTVHKKTYRRIGPPTEKPRIHVASVVGRTMTLWIRASSESGLRLPDDVTGAAVYRWEGDEPSPDLSQWTLAAHATRARIKLNVDARMGTKVHFCAYYLNRKGERGPLGPSTCTYAMGGMIAPSLAA